MVYNEKDVAVVYVPENKEICNEIRIRSKFYFNQGLLPQLVSDHFYASHHLKSVIEDDSVTQVEMAVVHLENVSSPVSQHHFVHHGPVVMPNVIAASVTIPQSNVSESNRSLVPAFCEFLVPVVFTPFKPFLLREKRVPPTLVMIRRLGFQSPFFTQIKASSFHRFFFFVSFPFFRRQNIKNFTKLNFLLIRS
jgi:hypothetical protein